MLTRATFLRQAKDGCEELILLVNNVLDALAVTEEMQPPPSEELFVAPLVCDVLDHLDPRKEQADRLSLEIPGAVDRLGQRAAPASGYTQPALQCFQVLPQTGFRDHQCSPERSSGTGK